MRRCGGSFKFSVVQFADSELWLARLRSPGSIFRPAIAELQNGRGFK